MPHAPAFAGKGHKVVVSAVITAGAGKAMGKDAASEVFAKRLADMRLWRVVVALPVELACAGEIEPGLEVFGNRLVQQRTLGVARVVELGLGRCCCLGRGRRTVARLVVRMGSAV